MDNQIKPITLHGEKMKSGWTIYNTAWFFAKPVRSKRLPSNNVSVTSPDGNFVASTHSRRLILRSRVTNEKVFSLPFADGFSIISLFFTTDSKFLPFIAYDGNGLGPWLRSLRIFEAGSGKLCYEEGAFFSGFLAIDRDNRFTIDQFGDALNLKKLNSGELLATLNMSNEQFNLISKNLGTEETPYLDLEQIYKAYIVAHKQPKMVDNMDVFPQNLKLIDPNTGLPVR